MTVEKIEELCEGVDDGNRFKRFVEITNILLKIVYSGYAEIDYDGMMAHQPALKSITDPMLFTTTMGFAMLMDYDENDMATISGIEDDDEFEHIEGLVCGGDVTVEDYKYLKMILENMGEWEE